MFSATMLVLLLHAVYCQLRSSSFIQSEGIGLDERGSPILELSDLVGKFSPSEIEEYYDRDRLRKWNARKQPLSLQGYKKFHSQPSVYTTDHEVVDNDPIEQEIADMVPRARGFYEDSGLQMATNKPVALPSMSSEAEITMSMSTLPDKTAPDMLSKQLELQKLPTPSMETNDIEEDEEKPVTHAPISFEYRRSPEVDPYKKLALEGAVDVAAIPKMHNDVQKLIEDVAMLKKMVYQLLDIHIRERRRFSRRRRPNRKASGTSLYGRGWAPTETFTDHFVHTFDEKRDRRVGKNKII